MEQNSSWETKEIKIKRHFAGQTVAPRGQHCEMSLTPLITVCQTNSTSLLRQLKTISFIRAIKASKWLLQQTSQLCRAAVRKCFSDCVLMLKYRFDMALFQYDSASLRRFWWAVPQNPLFFMHYSDVFFATEIIKENILVLKCASHPFLAC